MNNPELWFQGFEEGRRATARAVASKLRGTIPDEELAALRRILRDAEERRHD